MTPGVKRRMQPRGIARRQAILDAAIELMSTRGFRGTGYTALAEKVGITEAGVLHYFDSKEDLLLAVLQEQYRRNAPLRESLAEPGGPESWARLPELARHLMKTPDLIRLHFVLQAEHLDGDGPAHAWFVRWANTLRTLIADGLRRGIEHGEIRGDLDVERKSAEIIAFFEGVHLQWLLDPDEYDLVGVYEIYASALTRDLATR